MSGMKPLVRELGQGMWRVTSFLDVRKHCTDPMQPVLRDQNAGLTN
jgi:hypothetical protein